MTLLDALFFSPASVTIAAGGSITWNWQGGQFHDVTSSSFASDPEGVKKAGSYKVTFSTPGSFSYICSVHEATGMRGVVIVR